MEPDPSALSSVNNVAIELPMFTFGIPQDIKMLCILFNGFGPFVARLFSLLCSRSG